MYWFGVSLIYAAVLLRALLWYSSSPYYIVMILMLAVYGLLLSCESLVERRIKEHQDQQLTWFRTGYLVFQASLITGILFVPPVNDFGAMLFIPISLQAVLFFDRRRGFTWITFFTLTMVISLIREGENFPSGFVMALLFGGICFLAGSYAHLIRFSEEAKENNQRAFDELQATDRQLQKYAIELEELTAERERIRLARDMHDSVTQTVFSMNLTVQSARLLVDRDSYLVREQLDRLQDLAREAMNEIQALITHLHPLPSTEDDVIDMVNRLIVEKGRLDGLQVSLEYSMEERLPKQEIDCLSKIVQEALTNIVKHSGTQKAVIRINFTKKPYFLEVEDQGSGFNQTSISARSECLGLKGMAERAREIGWSLSVDSHPGRGTLVRVEEQSG